MAIGWNISCEIIMLQVLCSFRFKKVLDVPCRLKTPKSSAISKRAPNVTRLIKNQTKASRLFSAQAVVQEAKIHTIPLIRKIPNVLLFLLLFYSFLIALICFLMLHCGTSNKSGTMVLTHFLQIIFDTHDPYYCFLDNQTSSRRRCG